MASAALQNESGPANLPTNNFPVAHLWAAVGDIPELYGLKAARGALRALSDAIDRAERGQSPLSIATARERKVALRAALPELGEGCSLA